MSVYIQPADIANEQQMVTPIEEVLKDGDNIALGNNFEKKLNFFDLPFHPLSLHDARDKNNGGLAVLQLQVQPKLEPLKMLSSQSNFIATKMHELRESECAAATKRRKTEHRSVDQPLLASESEHDDDEDVRDAVCADAYDDDSSIGCSISSSRFDIQDELKSNPHAIQIVATSGGLITHWNERFSKITKPSSSLRKTPLTIFDLVDLKSLPSLYSMLALSLHNIDVDKVENLSMNEEIDPGTPVRGRQNQLKSYASHLSITVPCKPFRKSSISYNITVVFMDDIASNERCFLGILTPRPTTQDVVRADSMETTSSTPRRVPCGKIVRVDDNLLCRLLLGTRLC